MMPFSVLRIFGVALFGWGLLGAGAYLSYKSYLAFTTEPIAVVAEPSIDTVESSVAAVELDESTGAEGTSVNSSTLRIPESATSEAVEQITVSQSVDWRPWALLAGAIICLGLSVGGKWPAEWILANRQGKSVPELEPNSTYAIDRPDGSQLHVEVFGKTDGPTLIFTHGWTLDSSAWKYITVELAKYFRIIAWDLPGLGKSRGPSQGTFTMEKLAQDLEAVLSSSASVGPAILVGHSIGGMTQQTFCRLFPQHLGKSVVGMVLVHTTYTNPVRTNFASTITSALEVPIIVPLNYLMIVLSPLAWVSNWQSYWNGSSHWTTRFTSFTGRQTREQLDHSARMGAAAWPATVARGNLAMLRFEAREILPDIQIPVLVIGGEHDRVTVCAASDQISTLLPNDRPFRIAGGHLGYWEFADDVSDAINEFATPLFFNKASLPKQLEAKPVM